MRHLGCDDARMPWAGTVAICCLLIAVVSGFTAPRGLLQSSLEERDERERVRATIRAAQEEMHRFHEAGGDDGDPEHPARKWADRLWRYRGGGPATPAAALATSEALHLRAHAGDLDQMVALASSLGPGEAEWSRLIDALQEAEALSGREGFFVETAGILLDSWSDPEALELLQLRLAEAYFEHGDTAQAKKGFQGVLEAGRDESRVAEAVSYLREIDHLQPGQRAPEIAGTARDGSEVSLASLRGRPVLIIYWASW